MSETDGFSAEGSAQRIPIGNNDVFQPGEPAAVAPASKPVANRESTSVSLVAQGGAEAAQPREADRGRVAAQQPPTERAEVTKLFTWIEAVLLEKTSLPEYAAELFALWTISTWFPTALKVFPCLAITGSTEDAYRLLHVLKQLCLNAALVAGFKRSHLEALRPCLTTLIAEPNLDEQTANLISSLTDGEFMVVLGSGWGYYSKSIAIYAGENPEIRTIRNSIHLHLTPTDAKPMTDSPQWPQETIRRIHDHLEQYSKKNLPEVKQFTWAPSGLSPEMTTVATELGRCLVDAPELRQKLVALLKAQDRQRRTDMGNTAEAFVLESILHLLSQGKAEIFVGEIAKEANSIKEARGERHTFSAEKVGHLLKKLGLHTRRVSAGMQLVIDSTTIAQVRKLAAMYGGVGLDEGEK